MDDVICKSIEKFLSESEATNEIMIKLRDMVYKNLKANEGEVLTDKLCKDRASNMTTWLIHIIDVDKFNELLGD
jgi:hypothetical protein